MSRHAFGPPWHQGYMLPCSHGNQCGEAFPKLAAQEGPCHFRGVPGDFPTEKKQWYRPASGFIAGESSLCQRGRGSGNVKFRSSGAFGIPPDFNKTGLSNSASSPQLGSARSVAEDLPRDPSQQMEILSKGAPEASHLRLHYGRQRPMPETLRTAGVSAFAMRRFQETNTAIPFL
eukprot:TRINITY_DN35225_c0_g1_i1.p1 TRINITY_DN35225_c0_g1~~TRINITY_DN35225_c0_g1_i1.p1  ORF type:complete len:175 (-),score=28.82 TRINITY_DN35225_c0_g1_i1:104-628(-)